MFGALLLTIVMNSVKQLVVAALLVANVPMAMYFSLVHQRGTIAVMSYLRQVSNHCHMKL